MGFVFVGIPGYVLLDFCLCTDHSSTRILQYICSQAICRSQNRWLLLREVRAIRKCKTALADNRFQDVSHDPVLEQVARTNTFE